MISYSFVNSDEMQFVKLCLNRYSTGATVLEDIVKHTPERMELGTVWPPFPNPGSQIAQTAKICIAIMLFATFV